METSKNTKVIWTGRVISVIATLPFVMSSTMKLIAHPKVMEGMSHLGLPGSLIWPLGLVELLCVVVYLIPATSVLGAILFTGYIGGAILAHLRIGEAVFLQIMLGVLIWLGLYLREPRLCELLPLRKNLKQHT